VPLLYRASFGGRLHVVEFDRPQQRRPDASHHARRLAPQVGPGVPPAAAPKQAPPSDCALPVASGARGASRRAYGDVWSGVKASRSMKFAAAGASANVATQPPQHDLRPAADRSFGTVWSGECSWSSSEPTPRQSDAR